MKSARGRVLPDTMHDSGLTLIEVLAAVIVITIVALSSAGLSINGIQTAAAQERQQVAVTIANGAMEKVSGWNTSSGVSNLYTGRCQADVTAAFTANSSQPGVSATYPAWDPSATSSGLCSTPSLPTVQSPAGSGVFYLAPQNGTNYTLTTLIGTCYEPVSGSSGSCGLLSGYSSAPASAPTGYTALVRVIVVVSWAAGKTCLANGCSYTTSTLIDPHTDLSWVSS